MAPAQFLNVLGQVSLPFPFEQEKFNEGFELLLSGEIFAHLHDFPWQSASNCQPKT